MHKNRQVFKLSELLSVNVFRVHVSASMFYFLIMEIKQMSWPSVNETK